MTKRRSISLLIAIEGRIRSAPMHTPTTTTRENSGAPAMISSITPGTPTHSKTTGRFGLRSERLGGPPHVPPRDAEAVQPLHRPERHVGGLGDGVQVALRAGRRERRVRRSGRRPRRRRTTGPAPAAPERGRSRPRCGRPSPSACRSRPARSGRSRSRPRPDACRPPRAAPRATRRPSARSARRARAEARSGRARSATPRRRAARRSPRRRVRQPDRVDPVAASPQRHRDDRGPLGGAFRQPGPCATTSPQNSCPNTISSWERMKPS